MNPVDEAAGPLDGHHFFFQSAGDPERAYGHAPKGTRLVRPSSGPGRDRLDPGLGPAAHLGGHGEQGPEGLGRRLQGATEGELHSRSVYGRDLEIPALARPAELLDRRAGYTAAFA